MTPARTRHPGCRWVHPQAAAWDAPRMRAPARRVAAPRPRDASGSGRSAPPARLARAWRARLSSASPRPASSSGSMTFSSASESARGVETTGTRTPRVALAASPVHPRRVRTQVMTVEHHASCRRRVKAREQPEQRRFAGPRCADDRDRPPAVTSKTHIAEYGQLCVAPPRLAWSTRLAHNGRARFRW